MKLQRFEGPRESRGPESPSIPNAALHGDADLAVPASLAEFWMAAAAELHDDYSKSIFAHWLVGTLLGLPMRSVLRAIQAGGELALPGKAVIEVRAASVLGSWNLAGPAESTKPVTDPTKIVFRGLRGAAGVAASLARLASGQVVFCFQSERDPAKWDAWDLSQWEFYVVPRTLLSHVDAGDSITLARLRALRTPLTVRKFQAHMVGWRKENQGLHNGLQRGAVTRLPS